MIDQLVHACKERGVDLQDLLRTVQARRKAIMRTTASRSPRELDALERWVDERFEDPCLTSIVMDCIKALLCFEQPAWDPRMAR